MSWPPGGSVAVDPAAVASGDALSLLEQWEIQLLCDPVAAADARARLGIERPYSDPWLIRSLRKYSRFVVRLAKRGMLHFAAGGQVVVGCFCVRKSNGSQRIVFDTRLVNMFFVEPAVTHLPMAGTFAAIEAPVPFEVHQGDVCNAF